MGDAETRLLIGGEQVRGEGDPLEVENPFTEETIATVGEPSEDQLDAAIAAGSTANANRRSSRRRRRSRSRTRRKFLTGWRRR